MNTNTSSILNFLLNIVKNKLLKKEIVLYFKQHFDKVAFCEGAFLKNTRRGKYIYAITAVPLTFIAKPSER